MPREFPILWLGGDTAVSDFDENVVQASPQLILTRATLEAPEFGAGRLTISGLLPTDRLTLATDGTVSFDRTVVRVDGVTVGLVSGGVGTDFRITFLPGTEDVDVQQVLRHVQYQSLSDNPIASHDLTVTLVNEGGALASRYFDRPGASPLDSIGPTRVYDDLDGTFVEYGDSAPAFVDLNADGKADLVLGTEYGNLRSFIRYTGSDGATAFREVTGTSEDRFAGINAGDDPPGPLQLPGHSKPAFADVNGDGRADLVVGTVYGTLRTFLRGADGGFTELTGSRNPLRGIDLGGFAAPALGDLNGDGRADLVVGSSETYGARVYLQNADHSFSEVYRDTEGSKGMFFAFASLSGNALPDLIRMENGGSGFVTPFVIRWNGAGFDSTSSDITDEFFPNAAFAFGDVNGDGWLELVTGTEDGRVFTGDFGPRIATINITPQNDAATITGALTAAVTEAGGRANGSAGTPTATGALLAADPDGPANTFQAVAAGTPAGRYGTYSVTTAGTWTYTLDNTDPDVEQLRAGERLTDSFIVRSADGTGAVVRVTITGTNDAAVIAGSTAGALVEAGGVANGAAGTATATGTLTATDVDGRSDRFQQIAAGTGARYGTYEVDGHGDWTYWLDDLNADVQRLRAGEQLVDRFDVRSEDGTVQAISVTITGANDAAAIGGTTTGGVVEADALSAGTPTATGRLTAQDVDGRADRFQAVAAGTASVGGFGTFAMSANGTWTYTLDNGNAAVNGLNPGETLTDSFTVRAEDGTAQVVVVTISGGGLPDGIVLPGSGTSDLLVGDSYADTLSGGAGNDVLEGRGGPDRLDGGAGATDFASYEHAVGPVTASLAAPGGNLGEAAGDSYIGVEGLIGSGFADELSGNGAANFLDGGAGADTMAGGAGSDVYYVDDVGDTIVEMTTAATEADTVIATVSVTLSDNVERASLRGTGAIDATGNSLGNLLNGNEAGNHLFGLGGNDKLFGFGGADTLDGGANSDVLTGGDGSDVFLFAARAESVNGGARDRILDFDQSAGPADTEFDRIDLSGFDANTRVAGEQSFTVLGGEASFTGAGGELRFLTLNNVYVVQGDTDGDKRGDFEIAVTSRDGLPFALTAADFIL